MSIIYIYNTKYNVGLHIIVYWAYIVVINAYPAWKYFTAAANAAHYDRRLTFIWFTILFVLIMQEQIK